MNRGISHTTGVAYGARAVNSVLDLPTTSEKLVPLARRGEIIVYYGGWDLQQLCTCRCGVNVILQNQDWYNRHAYAVAAAYYRVRLPFLGSNRRTGGERSEVDPKNWAPNQWGPPHRTSQSMVDSEWQTAPTPIALTALLIHFAMASDDVPDDFYCSTELGPAEQFVHLTVKNGQIRLGVHSGQHCVDEPSIAVSRKC